MRYSNILICLMILLMVASLPVAADNDRNGALPELPMVLTPARLQQPQAEVPASVTVIDRELIEASGAREIYQLLQLVPGMAAVDVDGNVPTVSYHATLARDIRRMLVLVDGRSMYQPGLARVQWNEFPLAIEDVERIEITRGPASAAYGANAFSAVINIITRHPRDVYGTTVATRHGGVADSTRNGVRDWRLTHAGHREQDAIRLTISSQRDDGYDEPFAGIEPRDEKLAESFNLRYVHDLPKGSWSWLAGGSRVVLERPINSDFEPVMAVDELPVERAETVFTQFRFRHAFSRQHQLRAQIYLQHEDSDNTFAGCLKQPGSEDINELGGLWFSRELRQIYEANDRDIDDTFAAFGFAAANPGTDPALDARLQTLVLSGAGPLCPEFRFDVQEQRVALELEDTLVLSDRVRLVSGAEVREDRVQSETYLDGTVSNVSGRVFGNLELSPLDDVRVNLGGYWERDEINGSYTSPRAALNWTFYPGHTLRLVRARSIRSMDIYEKRADVQMYLHEASGAWRADTQGLLGWAAPEFFVAQNSDGSLDAERIDSRELGYFARVGSWQWDVRYFREQLDDLISGGLNPFDFRPNNLGEVLIEGREVELSWRPHPAHLFRATGAHIHTSASNPQLSQQKAEKRLAAEDIASFLWRFDFAPGWMASSAWYMAQSYNDYDYERADLQLKKRIEVRGLELEFQGVAQHDIAREPVVFEENIYQGDTRYWMGMSLTL